MSTVKKVFDEAVAKKNVIKIGTTNWHNFVLMGWKGDDDVSLPQPFLVTVVGDVAIEVDRLGRFADSYPAQATGYYEWLDVVAR